MCPSVIDTLIIEVGIDPTKLRVGQRQAIDDLRKFEEQSVRSGKNIEHEGRNIGNTLANLKREALGVTTLFLGGMGVKQFTGFITNLDAATGRFAKTMNLSVESLGAWQGAAKMVGGTAEGITGSMQSVSDMLNKFTLGIVPAQLQALNQIGVDLIDRTTGRVKDVESYLLDVSGKLMNRERDPARRRAYLSELGYDQGLIDLLINGPGETRRLLGESRKAGGPNTSSAAEAKKYQEEIAKLDQSLMNLGRTIVTLVGPALTSVLNRLSGILQGFLIDPTSPEATKESEDLHDKLRGRFGAPPAWMQNLLGAPGGSIPVKPGAGASSQVTDRLRSALEAVEGIKQVTAMNDAYHTGGAHKAGNAIDLTISDPSKSAEMTNAIRARLAAAGISANVIDEYKTKSPGWTGGHIHVAAMPGGLPVGAGTAAAVSNVNSRTSSSSTSSAVANIGTINVVVPGGDANAIAGGIGGAMSRNLTVPANWGQQ